MQEIYIIGEVCEEMKMQVKMQLIEAAGQPVIVRIDSPGGDVFEGFSIFDALQNYEGKVTTIVESQAFSIASLIALAGEDREITENGYFMLHSPRTEYGGTADEMEEKTKLLRNVADNMRRVYSSVTGLSEDEVATILSRDNFYDAQQSLQLGLVTRVQSRIVPSRQATLTAKRIKSIPYAVVASLQLSTEAEEEPQNMANQLTVKMIKQAFPKASSDFIVRCMEKEMDYEELGAEYVKEVDAEKEQLMAEKEELSAQVAAMEEEMTAMKEKMAAMEKEPVTAEEDEEEEKVTAKARAFGARPVAHHNTKSTAIKADYREQWREAIQAFVDKGFSRVEATKKANRAHPGLRAAMLEQINA